MKVCTACSVNIPQQSKFCPYCGAKQLESVQQATLSFTIRVRSAEYDRLTDGWKQIQVSSKQQWEELREKLLQEFRTRFGYIRLSRAQYGLTQGAEVPRWNDATWNIVKRTLVIDNEDRIQEALRKLGA